jgi:hypothetical protein
MTIKTKSEQMRKVKVKAEIIFEADYFFTKDDEGYIASGLTDELHNNHEGFLVEGIKFKILRK